MKFLPSLATAALVPVLLANVDLAQAGRQVVENRRSTVPPIPVPLPHRGSSNPAIKTKANAQIVEKARAVEIQGDSLDIPLGDVVLLPFSGVTRIITEDDEVARAFFQNGSPVLQGVAVGTTIVEIYQASGTPRVLTINVTGASALPKPASTPTPVPNAPTPTPEPVAPDPTPTPVPAEPTPTPDVVTLPPPTLGGPTGLQNGDPLPPSPVTDLAPLPDPSTTTSIAPSRSSLSVALRGVPTPGNPAQATFTVSYANPGSSVARGTVVRFALDERVSYVTDSASNGGQYDPAQREVVWNVGDVPAGFSSGQLSLRVEPVERTAFSFNSQATIEDTSGSGPVSSAQVRYSTSTTPLLTVFAMPDRFLAAAGGARIVDVRSNESQAAVDRLQHLGIVTGRSAGRFYPKDPTQRAEYAVMTLNGLNLRDLRDMTQIKFVLSRRSTVSLAIQNASGVRVADLVRQTSFEAGEHTAMWNGKAATGYAAPGRYTYVCTARDARGEVTTLRGIITLVPTTPLELEGLPSFVDVKASDWFARYLAVGEKQGLVFGFPDKTFRPRQPISRVEATAIVVRALGLSDVARQWADKDVGFLDYAQIPAWARGSVNVATTVAKTSAGRPLMRGTPGNTFDPNAQLLRDQAAIIVQRLIDRETTRRVTVSGSIVPGAIVSINSRPISADGTGNFKFDIDMMTSTPTTVAVVDTRGGTF